MSFWQIAAIAFHVVVAPASAGHALLYKRDSRAAFGWMSVCVLFPVAGPILYYFFGVNRVRTRARELQGKRRLGLSIGFERALAIPHDSRFASDVMLPEELEEIGRLSDAVTHRSLVRGNHVRVLRNGEEAFPAMLEAIGEARSTVYLMTYIFETNRTGRQFVEALASAAGRGVDVRVVLDGLGELYSWPRAGRLLSHSGVRIEHFLPLRLLPPSLHVNLRNHRKLLLVDGESGFAGGMNLGDRHLLTDPENRSPTQDLQFCFRGPVLEQMHGVFAQTWRFVAREELPRWGGRSEPAGSAICRSVVDGPDEDLDRLELILIGTVASARRSLRIMTPYFLPSRELTAALKSAALKGVDVDILLPQRSNLPYVDWATNNMLWELLQQGIRVWRQPSPFAHTKLFVVDGHYTLVGSANIDPRSLRLNFELGIEVLGRGFGAQAAAHFDDVRERSRPVSLAQVDGRSIPTRLRDAACWLFSPYL